MPSFTTVPRSRRAGGARALVYAALLGLAGLAGIFRPAAADQLEDGIAALDRREYAAALGLLRPLAESGVPRAQLRLGLMHQKGLGVREDYVEAWKWFALAAEGFANIDRERHRKAVHGRNVLAKDLTPAQLAEARRRAAAWTAARPASPAQSAPAPRTAAN
jgi:TPR repeat protein